MVKASWNGKILAESSTTEQLEGNHYFPQDSLKKEYVKPSNHTSFCPSKGTASYYTLQVDGKENPNAVWYYPTPKSGFERIGNHVAFWKGVNVE